MTEKLKSTSRNDNKFTLTKNLVFYKKTSSKYIFIKSVKLTSFKVYAPAKSW